MNWLARTFTSTAWVFAILIATASLANAYSTVDEAGAAIEETAQEAVSDTGAIVAQTQQSLSDLTEREAIEAVGYQAVDQINGIWATARDLIDEIRREFPRELAQDASTAKAAIQQARLEARQTVEDMVADALGHPSATTTTTKPTTSMTSTTTLVPGSTSTPSTTSTTTTTLAVTPAGPVEPPESGPRSGEPQGDGESETRLLSSPEIPGIAVPTPSSRIAVSPGIPAETTSAVARGLEIMLHPAVVDLVVSPFLVLEVLIRTALEGSRSAAPPLALLAMVVIAVLLVEKWSLGIAAQSAQGDHEGASRFTPAVPNPEPASQ